VDTPDALDGGRGGPRGAGGTVRDCDAHPSRDHARGVRVAADHDDDAGADDDRHHYYNHLDADD
jgi:hypothetical protein